MKIKNLIAAAALFVALAAMTTPAYALTSVQAKRIKETVLSVPVPEMPAKAADIVTATEKKDREEVAVTLVRAVIAKHRAAAPVLVAAISKVAPEVSAAVAKAATQEAPEQKSQILSAATTAAPGQASLISTVSQSAVTPVGSTLVGGETSGRSVAADTTSSRNSEVVERNSAAPSEGTIIILPGPVRYQNPNPPQPPARPPVLVTPGTPRVR
jgi:hypothetical protein